MKRDFGETAVVVVVVGGLGNLEPIQDPFPITKSRHKNMWFTSDLSYGKWSEHKRVAE